MISPGRRRAFSVRQLTCLILPLFDASWWRRALSGFGHPVAQWSPAYQAVAGFALGTLVFIAVHQAFAWRDLTASKARHAEWSRLEAELRRALAQAAALPALRAQIKSGEGAAAVDNTVLNDAALLEWLAALSAASHVQLDTLELSGPATQPGWRERLVRLRAIGSFTALTEFSSRLAAAIWPVLPTAAGLRAQASELSLDLSLRLIAVRTKKGNARDANAFAGERGNRFGDPFAMLIAQRNNHLATAGRDDGSDDNKSERLLGVLQREGRGAGEAAALIEVADRRSLLRVGDHFGDETVAHIDAAAVTLVSRAGAGRTLTLETQPN